MQAFDCVIFDCDGTLVESESLQCELLVDELRARAVTASVGELMLCYRGWTLAQIVADLSRKYELDFGPDFTTDFRDLELHAIADRLTAVDGVHAALSDIEMLKCVASSGPRLKIRRALTVTGLEGFFGENLFSCHDIKKWKPDPDVFWYAADCMGVCTQRCVVVEDSAVGVQAAVRAGMPVIHYLGTSDGKLEPGAIALHDMRRLPEKLAEFGGGRGVI